MTREGCLPFGDLLHRYRAAASLSQEALAERAGLSARAISDLERGVKQAPRPTTMQLRRSPTADADRLHKAEIAGIALTVCTDGAADVAVIQGCLQHALSPYVAVRNGAGGIRSLLHRQAAPHRASGSGSA